MRKNHSIQRSLLLLFTFVVFTANLTAQDKSRHIFIGAGYSQHGTGDLTGYTIITSLSFPLGKTFTFQPGIEASGNSRVGAQGYRLVTSGLNLNTNLGWNIIAGRRHLVELIAGPFLRRQTSSYPDSYGGFLDQNGEWRQFWEFTGKPVTYSLGYSIAPSYHYKFNNRFMLGGRILFQNDTEADALLSYLVSAGFTL